MVGRAVHGVRTLLAHHSSPVAWGGYKKSGISHEVPLLHQLLLIRKKIRSVKQSHMHHTMNNKSLRQCEGDLRAENENGNKTALIG